MSALIPPTRLAVIAAGTVLTVFGLLVLGDRGCSRKADAATRKADEAKGEAVGRARQAISADQKAAANDEALANLKAEKDELLAELDHLRAKVGKTPSVTVLPAPKVEPLPDGGSVSVPVVPGPAEVVAKQDEVIRAQGAYISRLEDQVSTLTSARNHWKAAFEAEERRAVALELALKAQKSADAYKSAKWGLLGVAVGFVGGRL